MAALFFDQSELAGCKIIWNVMETSFSPKEEEFDWSVLYVRYPNDCRLEVMWYGAESNRPVGFYVTLVHTNGEWEPCKEEFVPRMEDLRTAVQRLAKEASARPSIRRHLSGEWDLSSPFREPPVDNLILDPLAPLASQLDALKAQLFVGLVGVQGNVIISWEPPHQYPGNFVVRTYDWDPERWGTSDEDDNGGYPPRSWILTGEWKCGSIDALRRHIEGLDAERRATDR